MGYEIVTLENKRASGNGFALGGSMEYPFEVCCLGLRIHLHNCDIFFYPVLFSCWNVSVNRLRVEFKQGCHVSSLERCKGAEGLCKRTRVMGHKSKPEVRTGGYEDRKSVKGDNVNY